MLCLNRGIVRQKHALQLIRLIYSLVQKCDSQLGLLPHLYSVFYHKYYHKVTQYILVNEYSNNDVPIQSLLKEFIHFDLNKILIVIHVIQNDFQMKFESNKSIHYSHCLKN